MQSSFSAFPFVFFTRSVTEPAPQNSITSYGPRSKERVRKKTMSGKASAPSQAAGGSQRFGDQKWDESNNRTR